MAVNDNPKDKVHSCPFCDEEIAEAAFPYCEACQVKLLRCPQCHEAIPRTAEKCPYCGSDTSKVVNRGG
jgi:primosomal protein N'